MILAVLILQAAAPQSAIDAERAFNAAAQAKGQWTAFREFAASDAVMFVPQPVKAQDWLKDRKDPAKAVEWWPTESWVSCSGTVAVNTGGWKLPDGTVGFFSTVWRKEADGSWKWIVDGGDALKVARERPAKPRVVQASCGGKPRIDMGGCISDGANMGCDVAKDQTLQAHWSRQNGKRLFRAAIWTGREWKTVLEDTVIDGAQ